MKDEIKEIIEYFKDDIDYLEEDLKYPNFKGRYITIRDKEYEYLRKLLNYITNLQSKIEENGKFDETMKDIKDNLIERINRQEKEIERLNNIINELEEAIKNKIKGFKEDKDYFIDEKELYELNNLIQELKGDSSNE